MKIALFLIAAALASAQINPTTRQQATNCAQNFAGSNNTGTVTCYGVDKKLADQIGQLVAASKRDGKTLKDISDKLDAVLKELQSPPANITIQQAPNGINIGPGAIVPNPQVFNGPPPAHLRFTEETVPTPPGGNGDILITVHVFTDRSIPGALIGFIFSGPIEVGPGEPSLKGAAITQFNWGALSRGTASVPNSLGVSVNAPSAFLPGQELIIPIKSKTVVHVLEVGTIGN